ncbi:hypothetical protein [Haloferax mediterranei]|uniref:hypothetical protein n=1 Tax=Haloferax mediterranei TaxID=2252 RepID=UPI001EE67CD2|nr:hypothetical protein [Haloferax mediterranei]
MRVDTDKTRRRPSLVRLFKERTHPKDIALILTFPVILTLVHQLPLELRESLVFDYTDPTLLTAFTSSFVHLETGHLFTNVFLYFLVVPVLYILGVVSGSRRQFHVFVITVLVAFPPVLSYMNLAITRSSVTFGSSGIVMAFAGCLPLALADYFESEFGIGPVDTFAPMMFITSVGLISVLSVQSVIPENSTVLVGTAGLILVVLLTILLYVISAYKQENDVRSKLRSSAEATGYFELIIVTGFLFVTILLVAFPVDPTTEGGILNLYEHFVGYSLGFIASFTTVELTRRIERRDVFS